MAIPDGKPATDFSAMNREWVRAVAEEAAESGGGIPAPENPSNGDVLTYNSTTQKWEAADPPASGIPAPASPSNGDVLTYDSTGSAWVAAAPSGAEKFVVTYEVGEGNAVVANKTYAQILAAYTAGKEISAVFFDSPDYENLYLSVIAAGETNGRFIFRGLPYMYTDDPDTPTEFVIRQEEITHGVTDSVESITESYVDVTIPLS